ncbi:MAG: tRNA uridine-5-carboxymethylaminomethyl(34) synthesis GTPase MnmE [Chitinivibrionales bacterium]|nr:tRNA uridine-5-carboxymethylaminomethyl(34) synthesis GTPase MnmE [Chitinivibrionales bacterium]
MNISDTIAAPATAAGVGAVALIRVSGQHAHACVEKCLREKEKFSRAPAHKLLLYTLLNPETNDIADEVTAVRYSAPHSYSAEDMVEIICHGGSVVIEKIMSILLQTGMRYAGKGEFTQRAFLNGKVTAIKSEAINDLINSKNTIAYKNALNNYFGDYETLLGKWKEALVEAISLIESHLEFPEADDVAEGEVSERVHDTIAELTGEIEREMEKRKKMSVLERGVVVAIIGNKNAGKSSLFNILIGGQRAIVHEKEGTTRDFLTEKISIRGIEATLVDTAGLGSAGEEIEEIGIQRAWEYAHNADIRILVTSADREFTQEEENIMRRTQQEDCLYCIVSKKDLVKNADKISTLKRRNLQYTLISLIHEEGKTEVQGWISNRLEAEIERRNESSIFQNLRHEKLADTMLGELKRAQEYSRQGYEMASFHLRNALTAIEDLVGNVAHEDILNNIFSQFCIGK